MRKATGIAATLAAAGLIAAGAAAPASAKQVAPSPTIVDVAIAVNSDGPYAGLFDTVLTAATCDSLDGAIVAALSARGQRTLFAPIDPAFEALGLTPENVCSIPAGVLADVLTYHVTKGSRDAGSVLDASSMRMLNGDRVEVDAADVQLIDGLGRESNIIVTDVPASNGIIHAIDSVLLPPGFGS
jgi:uncharacterized surface protein with fasciclin (FAS1) repeats